MATLYEQIGGQPAVDALVEQFYAKMLSDPRTKEFFRVVNMDNLKRLQKQWWAVRTGSVNVYYEGRDMHAGHTGMSMQEDLLQYIKVHILLQSARELGMPENLVAALGTIWDGQKYDIVGVEE